MHHRLKKKSFFWLPIRLHGPKLLARRCPKLKQQQNIKIHPLQRERRTYHNTKTPHRISQSTLETEGSVHIDDSATASGAWPNLRACVIMGLPRCLAAPFVSSGGTRLKREFLILNSDISEGTKLVWKDRNTDSNVECILLVNQCTSLSLHAGLPLTDDTELVNKWHWVWLHYPTKISVSSLTN